MTTQTHGWDAIQEAVTYIQSLDARKPEVTVVLGSGLGALTEQFANATAIPYGDIPHFATPSVAGHAGQLVIGELNGRLVAALQGRAHRYEGNPLASVVFPVRVTRALGAKILLVTNAAGSLRPERDPGTLMAINDQMNLTGEDPLRGPNDDRLGPRFPDMSFAYRPELTEVLVATAKKNGFDMPQGVYVGLGGPCYETPAEVRRLQAVGGDVVGMSTVHEIIAGVHMGYKCCGVTCITNLAAGISDSPITHDEVQETAAIARERFTKLLSDAIPHL